LIDAEAGSPIDRAVTDHHERGTMNDISAGTEAPAGFQPIPLGPEGSFAVINGPLFGKVEAGGLRFGFRVEPRHCNPAGICHGGMMMNFADMVLGLGANFAEKLGRFLPTVNMTSDFLAPAPLGSWVEGQAEVLRVTRNLVFAQCLVTADGTPVMRASAILKIGAPFDHPFFKAAPKIS
jgi:uncharacterized protein (TIGR00369 family)